MSFFFQRLKETIGGEAQEKEANSTRGLTEHQELTQPVEPANEEKPRKPRASKRIRSSKKTIKVTEGQLSAPPQPALQQADLTEPLKEESLQDVITSVPIEVESNDWLAQEPEGELSVDVYQTENEIVIQSTIAGMKAEDLDISIESDLLTIRGRRENPNAKEPKEYFTQECYWGLFSRQIILPEEIDVSRAKATLLQGVFILRLPKTQREKLKRIRVAS